MSPAEAEPRASGLYAGIVTHERFAPRSHRLRYRIFQLLIDLDELPALDNSLGLFAHNRFALFSLHDRDHGTGDGRPLRAYVDERLAEAGIEAGGAVRLLTMPRVLGHGFNPLSIYFCHRPAGDLAAVLYEVTNTFGERHSYLFDVSAQLGELRHGTAKRFFVSPFLDLGMRYEFCLTPPGEGCRTTIRGWGVDGTKLITATFVGRRAALTDRTLLAAFCTHPLLTLKVVAAIHWEALKLAIKGVPLRRKPPPPADAITIIPAAVVTPGYSGHSS